MTLVATLVTLALLGAVIYGVVRMLPKGRWRTGPVTITVFLIALGLGLYGEVQQVKWGVVGTRHVLLAMSIVVFGAVALALMPAAVALIWCTVHNRRIARREET